MREEIKTLFGIAAIGVCCFTLLPPALNKVLNSDLVYPWSASLLSDAALWEEQQKLALTGAIGVVLASAIDSGTDASERSALASDLRKVSKRWSILAEESCGRIPAWEKAYKRFDAAAALHAQEMYCGPQSEIAVATNLLKAVADDIAVPQGTSPRAKTPMPQPSI